MSVSGRYQRERNDMQRRINNEKKILQNRSANKKDEQIVKNIENNVTKIRKDFETEVKTLAKNINRERLRSFPFLRLSGNTNVTVDIPPVSKMDGYIKQLRNAAPTTANSRNSLQREVAAFAAEIRSDRSQIQ